MTTLNSILNVTGSQRNSYNISVIWQNRDARYTVEPLLTDTSLIRTVHCPGKMPIHSIIRTTDTKSRPQRENSYKLNLFITDTPMMTVLIQHDFLFVVTYQSVINCLIVHTITVSCFQSVKIILSTCHCHLSSRFLIL